MKIDPCKDKITFGKYKSQIWDQIADEDPNYVLWAADNVAGLKFPKKWLEAVEMDVREDEGIWWNAFESWNGYWNG